MRLKLYTALMVVLSLGFLLRGSAALEPGPAPADSAPVSRAEVDALKTGVEGVQSSLERMQQELAGLRALVASRHAPPTP
jgi:hypothetical protein